MKKMRNRTKIFIIEIIAFIIIILIALRFIFGYIPIFGRLIANSILSSYSKETIDSHYSQWPYSPSYKGELKSGDIISYSFISGTISDPVLSTNLEKKANELYQQVILEFPKEFKSS